MKWKHLLCMSLLLLVFLACKEPPLSSFDNEAINDILAVIDENSDDFVQQIGQFDSILTLAGTRVLDGRSERIKLKIFYFGEFGRGYFNLVDKDEKNLQFFCKKSQGYLAVLCVTKLNMEEAGGYIILNDRNEGIWSNVNFKKGIISLKKMNIDYNRLTDW